jgi:hypothetical protein
VRSRGIFAFLAAMVAVRAENLVHGSDQQSCFLPVGCQKFARPVSCSDAPGVSGRP